MSFEASNMYSCMSLSLFGSLLGDIQVIDRGTVVYKWVGADENSGASDPSKLPDLSPVKEALSRERGRL